MKQTISERPRTRRKRRSVIPDIAFILLTFAIAATLGVFAYSKYSQFLFKPKPADTVPVAVNPASQSLQLPLTGPSVSETAPSSLPAGSVYLPNPRLPLTIDRFNDRGVTLVLVEGGVLGTRRSPIRQGVEDFVREAGATAGINGTFFANASLKGTDNLLIGPSLCDNEASETMSPFDTKPQLEGRPLVVVSPTCTCIVPYDTSSLSLPGAIQNLLPDVTNAFLGGVWLVRGGAASTLDQLNAYNVHDAEDPRRRAFFAIMPDGRPVLGASDGSITSKHLARDLAAAGVREAVLLDSGFSTSLVFQSTILVTGHSTPTVPSRPVPQALVLYGQPDPSALTQVQTAAPAPPTS